MMMALAGAVVILLAVHLTSVLTVLVRLSLHRPTRPDVAPAVSLIRPVCGLDRFDAKTLESSFLQSYPDFEVIFCAARADDPAVAVIEGLIARYPAIRARLLIGEERISGNPKLNNLQKGWLAATADWVAMADANLLLPPDYLWQLVSLRRDNVGLVTSPPIGTRTEGAFSTLEAVFLNGNQARLQLFADSLGWGFAQGKTLFWNRAFLDAQGGLAALGSCLAEDVAATKVVRAAGKRVILTPVPFAQPLGPRSLRAVWMRQLRWAKVRRDGFPRLFLLEPLNGGLVPLALAWLVWGPFAALCVAGLWYGAEVALSRRSGWSLGPWSLPMMLARDLMIPLLWAASYGKRGFQWRGNAMAPVRNAQMRLAE